MRYLRGNSSSYTPTNLLFVDTETKKPGGKNCDNQSRDSLFLGVAISGTWYRNKVGGKRYHYFRTVSQFWKVVATRIKPKRPLWIFSHNSGFDATVCGLWQMVDRNEVILRFAVTESPPTICGFDIRGCKCFWLDSFNWFSRSIESIGADLGLEKSTMPEKDSGIDDWYAYCKRDCEILSLAIEALFHFHRTNDLGVFRMTAPSQALQTYRHRFMEKQECVREWADKNGVKRTRTELVGVIEPHDNELVKRLERVSYCAGYAWVYRVGKVFPWMPYFSKLNDPMKHDDKHLHLGPVYALDINSAYPCVMRSKQFPCRLRGVAQCEDRKGLYRKMDEYGVIANVLIETHTRPYPVKLKEHTNYHVGKFWTTLAGPELEKAREECSIRNVSMFAWYDTRELFTSYVDHFYPLKTKYRKQGNKLFDELCKLMLNSLPGKFGQRVGRWQTVKDKSPMCRWQTYSQFWPETKRVETFRGLGDLLQIRGGEEDAEHTLVAIPAYVNSYARLRLWMMLNMAGLQNVFYCSVDSIHCNEEGYKRLQGHGMIAEHQLGRLRLEGVYEEAEYRDVRNYTLGTEHKISGISRKAIDLGNLTFKQPEFERLDSILDRPQDSTVGIVDVVKEVDSEFSLGAIDKEGRTWHRRLAGGETCPLQGIEEDAGEPMLD